MGKKDKTVSVGANHKSKWDIMRKNIIQHWQQVGAKRS